MKERPILFSAPMVRALLEGRKTQTRRVVKSAHLKCADVFAFAADRGEWEMGECHQGPTAHVGWLKCPYGQPGDRLWVRETFYCDDFRYPDGPHEQLLALMDYRADHRCANYEAGCPCRDETGRSAWRPSIYMPRWASRITLEVTEVRVERLNDISQEGAFAEGALADRQRLEEAGANLTDDIPDPQRAFRKLWESINGAGSWAANPWVWCIGFKRVEQQREQLEKREGAESQTNQEGP